LPPCAAAYASQRRMMSRLAWAKAGWSTCLVLPPPGANADRAAYAARMSPRARRLPRTHPYGGVAGEAVSGGPVNGPAVSGLSARLRFVSRSMNMAPSPGRWFRTDPFPTRLVRAAAASCSMVAYWRPTPGSLGSAITTMSSFRPLADQPVQQVAQQVGHAAATAVTAVGPVLARAEQRIRPVDDEPDLHTVGGAAGRPAGSARNVGRRRRGPWWPSVAPIMVVAGNAYVRVVPGVRQALSSTVTHAMSRLDVSRRPRRCQQIVHVAVSEGDLPVD